MNEEMLFFVLHNKLNETHVVFIRVFHNFHACFFIQTVGARAFTQPSHFYLPDAFCHNFYQESHQRNQWV